MEQPVDYEKKEEECRDCDGILTSILLVGLTGIITGFLLGIWIAV